MTCSHKTNCSVHLGVNCSAHLFTFLNLFLHHSSNSRTDLHGCPDGSFSISFPARSSYSTEYSWLNRPGFFSSNFKAKPATAVISPTMYFVFPDKKSLHGIILLLIRVNNGGFTVMLGPAHLCFPFNFHTQRLHLCVFRYIQNDLSRYKIPAGEGVALIDRIVSNRNVWHLVSWCQSASDVWTELLEFITTTVTLLQETINKACGLAVGGTYCSLKLILGVVYIYIGAWWKMRTVGLKTIQSMQKPSLVTEMGLCRGANLGKEQISCCIKTSRSHNCSPPPKKTTFF